MISNKTAISGENFVKMREISEALNLTFYQTGNFLIFLVSIDDELQSYILDKIDADEFHFCLEEKKYPIKDEG